MSSKVGERLAAKREMMLKGYTSSDAVSPEVQDIWRKSIAAKLPVFKDKLPDSALVNEIMDKYGADIERSMRSARSTSEYHNKIAERLKIASFLAADWDGKLIIYIAEGDKELVSELREKNFGLFTQINSSIFQFSAISRAMATGESCWVYEGESYQDIFAEYVFFISPVIGNLSFRIHEQVCEITVVRAKDYGPSVKDFAYAKQNMARAVIALPQQPELQILDNAVTQKYIREKIGYVIVDSNHVCIGQNHIFCDMVERELAEVRGWELSDVFEELVPIMDKMLALPKPEPLTKIPLIRVKKNRELLDLYVDCEPAYFDGELYGATFFIRTVEGMKDMVNNILSPFATFTFSDIIGNAPNFLEVKKTAMRVANSDSNVLITSESGTGKELFAQAIHNASKRASKPFIAINCGAIPKELIGSELFGYEPGAFTGARKDGAMGKIEQADGGTVFLDEIGEMPLDMQTSLLRVLDSGNIVRLGSTQVRKVNARIIAATNRDLYKSVLQGSFRLDLYYRLNVINLCLPPLRERKADIPILAGHYLETIGNQLGRKIYSFSDKAMDCLLSHDWPGNIRELRNVVECCVNIEMTSTIGYDSLPANLRTEYEEQRPVHNEPVVPEDFSPDEEDAFERAELLRIKKMMIECNGNKSLVAKKLGMSRGKLYRKLERITNWKDIQ